MVLRGLLNAETASLIHAWEADKDFLTVELGLRTELNEVESVDELFKELERISRLPYRTRLDSDL